MCEWEQFTKDGGRSRRNRIGAAMHSLFYTASLHLSGIVLIASRMSSCISPNMQAINYFHSVAL